MWDNADFLNGCANALYALAAAAMIYAGVHAAIHSPLLPLRQVALQGELAHVTREQAESAARAAGTDGKTRARVRKASGAAASRSDQKSCF